ncbi:CHAT domain-containing protein [Burkholderia vietnamiensis]|uniref:CHAT domain-containing protein n=1 Tax=Burkholderia vietnamiensis TaxID=60552 RepID=UPI001B9EDB8C|nr:CHAT domain-containing protein [Burkholderia vietnamiensis]MBR8000392.1 CHAT domain-containing protein [Burkholderia vietnamiensis]
MSDEESGANDQEYAAWVKLFAGNIEKNGIAFPTIDLFFTLKGDLQLKAAAAVAVLARVINKHSHTPAFQEIHVVAPKGALSQPNLVEEANDESELRPRVHVWELEQLVASSVLDRLARCPKHSALIVLQGALYVSENAEPAPVPLGEKFALAEDIWVPQLYRLVQGIEETNAEASCYVIVDSGESYPGREELRTPFMSLDSLVIVADETTVRHEVLAQNLPVWKEMLAHGRLGSALQSIDALPPDFQADKPHLRIQLLHAAGMAEHALDEIERLDVTDASVAAMLKLARIAAEAGGRPKSRALLESVLPRLLSVQEYEAALAVAVVLGSDRLHEQIATRYDFLYPLESMKRRRNVESLIATGRFADALAAANASDVSPELRAALEFCSRHLPETGIPNYASATRNLKSSDGWARTAFKWMVRDALRKHLLIHAFELVFGNFRPAGIETLGEHAFVLMRQLMLAIDPKGKLPVPEDRAYAAFNELISYVAIRPDLPARRFEIENLLSHRLTGKQGLVLLLHRVMNAKRPSVAVRNDKLPQQVDDGAVDEALQSVLQTLAAEGTVIAGRLEFPPGSFPDGVADRLVSMSSAALEQLVQDDLSAVCNVQDALTWLSIASAAAPHSIQPNSDLELYRRVAGRLATTGSPQEARNMIDLVLVRARSADLAGRREAWFISADIYCRLRQNYQGLVAATCGLSIDVPVSLEHALQEADVCTRLLRDRDLPELALRFHVRAAELLHELQQYDSQAPLHEFVGFSIEFQVLKQRPFDRARMLDLIDRMSTNARTVLARKLPPQPMALLLGQVILIAERANIPVPTQAIATRDQLAEQLKGHESVFYQQVATSQATPKGLLTLHQTTEQARYAADAAFDFGPVATGARRLLVRSGHDASGTVLALELLCDRAMPLPGWQTTARPVHQIATIADPANWTIELSRRGIDVAVIGSDEQGCAHAVLGRQGTLSSPMRLDEEFSVQGYLEWIKHYPYRYGIDEKTPNLFYTSTEGLNFPFDPERATAIIASNRLQQLPPNLYRVGEDFIGQLQPVFCAPSLGWLHWASSSPATTDKRLTGWISTAVQQGETLVIAKERLEETTGKYAIEVDTGQSLPDGFWGAEMSVVVAHGSVLPEGKYFQRVSDEGTLRVTTEEFAKAFRNVGVVVLFVCSAGRADQAPEGESTYGLARELLAAGCSAVVASPWPLDSRVPYHWFPAFMDAWSNGTNVATASFLANQHVAMHFSSGLANCLAMTVFGDGLRMRMQ